MCRSRGCVLPLTERSELNIYSGVVLSLCNLFFKKLLELPSDRSEGTSQKASATKDESGGGAAVNGKRKKSDSESEPSAAAKRSCSRD